MKKIFTLCLLAFMGTTTVNAQYVLNENFSSPTFPPVGWAIGNTTTNGNGVNISVWQTSGTAGGNAETGHAFCNFADWANSGQIDSLVSPVFTAASLGAVLSFDETYCPYTGSNDQLKIYASVNGGSTWILVKHFQASDLATVPPAGQSYLTPTAYEWTAKQYSIPTGTNRVKFEVITDYGNNLFFDNVTVGPPNCKTKSITNATICAGGSYSFNGTSYNAAGSYTKTGLTNAAGCDSTAILNLSTTLGTGNNGKGLSFDGNNDYVALPTGIVSSLNSFTIETWFLINNANNWQRVFDFGTGTNVNMFFTTLSNGRVPRFAITNAGGGAEQQISAYGLTSALQTGVWHHLAITLNAATTTGTMYIDGLQVGQNTGMMITPSSLGATTQNYLGKSQYSDPYFNGSIDEFRIWNTAKTLAQIQDNMGKELTGNEAGLVAYYNFNTSSGTVLINNKNNAFNGTLNNFALSGTNSNWSTYNTFNIAGADAVCAGASTTFSTTVAGGVWSTPASSQVTVNAVTGLVTGKNAGVMTIKYTVAGCGSVSKPFTVNAIPAAPGIGYALGTTNPQAGAPTGSFCVGRVFNVVGAPAGGAWTATGITSITSGGQVTINAAGAGSIKYTYTSAAGCSSSKTLSGNGYTCAARGTVSNEQLVMSNEFAIFPNPAKSVVSLLVDKLIGTGSIVVTDLYGKTVKIQTLSMGTNTIDVSTLSKGMYFVSTITSEGITTKKLIVE